MCLMRLKHTAYFTPPFTFPWILNGNIALLQCLHRKKASGLHTALGNWDACILHVQEWIQPLILKKKTCLRLLPLIWWQLYKHIYMYVKYRQSCNSTIEFAFFLNLYLIYSRKAFSFLFSYLRIIKIYKCKMPSGLNQNNPPTPTYAVY